MNEMHKTHKIAGRKIAPALLAILTALALGSLAVATGDAPKNVSGAGRVEQAALVLQAQQTQPGSEPLVPLDTTFTYQGRLKDGPNPANGQYDFTFKLFDSLTGGTQLGSTLIRSNVAVSEGLVTVSLAFGARFSGQARYLEVAVRPTGGGTFTTLVPRQPLTAAPYAMGIRPSTVITASGLTIELATTGLHVVSSVGAPAIHVEHAFYTGVLAESGNSNALEGVADGNGTGVKGEVLYPNSTGAGVQGISHGSAPAVEAINDGTGSAVRASSGGIGIFADGDTWAGYFNGDVNVTGSCCGAGSGVTRIDHPLDPTNKYLSHAFVESPDMMNIYNGNATLDAKGEATVVLPEWFGALNKEFRYQLTAVGAPGPNLYVSKKVENNRFSIAGGSPGMEVSWQVTGIRRDAYAEKHRIPVEEDKGADRGKYLHPTEHGQPESKGIGYEEQQKMEKQP